MLFRSVNFIEMKHGTKEDYLLLDKHEKKYIEGTADRLLKFMSDLTSTLEGYKISRLEHSLQTATRALKDKASDEMVVAALLHDIGDELAPLNHSEYAAALLKPFPAQVCLCTSCCPRMVAIPACLGQKQKLPH